MYEVIICTFIENERTEERDWQVIDAFGEFATKSRAEHVAGNLCCTYYEFVNAYCVEHDCDGIAFDVIDKDAMLPVTSYELTAAGNYLEWRNEECHEPIGFKEV